MSFLEISVADESCARNQARQLVLFSGAQTAGYASSACAQVAMRFLGKLQDT